MKHPLYELKDYRAYLREICGKNGTRQGHRSSIATAMQCHLSYLTRVLKNEAHISLEQAQRLNTHLNHSDGESHFFLLLVQNERAGTQELKHYFENQIQKFLQKRLLVRERIQIKKTLNLVDQATYYSTWYYAAIHVALTIPKLQTPSALADYFRLPISRVSKVLSFLTSVGLATENHGIFQVGEVQIHLGNQSPNITRHHTHWRNKAISSLDRETPEDLHYSAAVTLSKADALKLKDDLIEVIKNTARFISKSKEEEEVHCFTMDFFNLKA